MRNTVFKDYVNLRKDVDLEINEHLVDLANQVAKDIGINVNEEDEEEDLTEEHETDKHETVDVVTRKIGEGEQQLEKEVSWLKWVPKHTSVMSLKEIQDELKEKGGNLQGENQSKSSQSEVNIS